MKKKVVIKNANGSLAELNVNLVPEGGSTNMALLKDDAGYSFRFLTTSVISDDSDKRFVTDTQINYWNAKVERSELSAYLPLTGGNMAYGARISFDPNSYIGYGNADNATTTGYNLEIASWWGIGFKATVDNITRIVFDTRAGRILSKALRVSDFADGLNSVPVVSDANGSLVKTSFGADWINTNANRRFVTDTQVSYWNAKVDRSELGAYLPLTGGYLTGKVEIQANGGTHWSDSKLAVITTDNTKHPSIALHSPGSSAVTIYQRNFDLYIRTDFSDAGALVHKRIWSENNHGIGSGLNADLLDGFHASYFTDANNIVTNTGKRLVSDTQVSYWNAKVDRSELGAYLPLTGGTMSGRVMFDSNCYVGYGTGDGASTSAYNLEIASWYGVGFKDTNGNKTKIVFDTRAGRILASAVRLSDFADGQNAIPVVSDGSGNLVKSAFSADWINTNLNRRFVTDTQVSQWSNKVERSELGAYLPLTGGVISGKLDILAQGGTRLEDAKLCISTTNTSKPPSIAFHTPGVSAIQLYEKLGHLYIRNDNGTAYDNVNYKVWTQMNHGVDSGLNADLLDGYHASYFVDANNLITNTNKRLVSDAQITYWNGKVDRTELDSYLALSGGTMSGAIRFSGVGVNTIGNGTGDGATTSTYNLQIASWFGIGFRDSCYGNTYIVFDTRAGRILSKALRVSDFADGLNSVPVVSDANGNLVKTSFGADWVNTNANRRFVTDSQVSYWNAKVERSELGAYLPLTGGYLTGKVEIQANGGTHWSDSKLAVVTTDNTKHPSIALHSPGSSAVTIYQRNFDLFIRTDFSDAGALVHKRIWSENNHGIGSGLNADLLDGFHASYFTDANNIVTNTGKRLVSDTQVSYWNAKVDRSELGAYLPLTGGTMSGRVMFDSNCYVGYGTGDGASTSAYNLEIASWYGVGFKDTNGNKTKIVFDTRAGKILASAVRLSDFADGQNAIPVISDGSGNLVKSAFSADWINTNLNRRFVTDTQVSQWSNKVERSELGAYLPLTGGVISGKLDILAQGGTRLEEAKLCISTTNTSKPPSIAFHTPGVSAIQLYEKLGHLYIRNDNGTAYDNVNYKVWTQMNHGVDSGLNADLLDGYHASYFVDANNLITNTNKRLVSDAQITYWNGKVDRTELAAFLTLTGGTMTGAIRFNAAGSNNGISAGTGDGATTTAYNLEIASWYGVGFKSTLDNTTKIVFDARAGRIQANRVLLSDFADGQVDRLIVSQGDGSLVRSDKVRFGYNNHISTGTGDNATESTYNFEIASWWGIGFKCNVDNITRIVFDTRAGRISTKTLKVSDFADGLNSVPVVSDANGNLVKTSFGADWVNTNANRRFVTDTQVSYWNSKVDRSELGAYLPLTGGYLTGKVEIQANGGTHWSDSKLAVITTDNTKHPSITLHSPGSSAVTIYQRNFDLYIRTDYSDAGALVHKRIWSENNHGIGSGLNADLLDGFHAAYFTDANNIVTNANKRLVSDSQISYWNSKISGISLEENGSVKSGNNGNINFCDGAFIGASVSGNQVRFNVDVVNDDTRYNNTTISPISTSFIKGKIDGKADWGHSHHWDSIYGKPNFSVLLQENAADKGMYSVINFSSGAYNVIQVDGNTVRYHVDVVNDDSRWANWCTNPASVALVKSKIDGKADWGHSHSWESIYGKPTEFNPSPHSHNWNDIADKPFEFNGNVVSTNYWFNSKHGCVMEGMSYIHNISSEVIGSDAISTNNLRLNMTPSYSKSSAPSGYLTLEGNRVVFVNSFN
ncbi:tail fiber protein [Flectobacillus sp. BAB-3569]|uniref:tail fiber protein n=1 Tax=Flectobacillus sp. BAB-3569 TaxID=1509483 RepID=UPI000BA49EAF|nr:tail fiber protein [Flectobacillus sp. BAB-3569]PAC26947.1 hypothetical protein BWI92_23800 [Flectobacillus sp. BAB-3569]